MNVSDAYTEITEGSVRLLAVGTEERASKFPDVPTYQECGYDVIQYSMRAFGGPKGIPEDILQMLRQSYARAQADPEVQAYADNLGMFVDPKSPQQIQEAWDALDADMRALWETDPLAVILSGQIDIRIGILYRSEQEQLPAAPVFLLQPAFYIEK